MIIEVKIYYLPISSLSDKRRYSVPKGKEFPGGTGEESA